MLLFKKKKIPSFSQWKQIFKVFNPKERNIFLVLILALFISVTYLATDFYIKNTNVAPAFGGEYTEGVVGQPRFINPIYGETNDIDRSLIDLIYSGLEKYDKNGNIVNDLAEAHQVSDDGKTYTFTLKDNLYWQDGQKLTADDVIFTIKTIQNSDYKSPLRANWLNVDVEKTDNRTVTFSLAFPYNSFLENCTVKIIPAHIWQNVLPENFGLSSYNLQPIGSGPYILQTLNQDNSGFINTIELATNSKYFARSSYISNINFKFFGEKDSLIKAINEKKVDGFSLSAINGEIDKIKQNWGGTFNAYSFALPRYFAVFFNIQKPKLLSDDVIRDSLLYAVNKNELIAKVNDSGDSKAYAVDSPILPNYFGFAKPTQTYHFNVEEAKNLLEKADYALDATTGKLTKKTTKQPAFQFTSYLKQGSTGNEVSELETCLINLDPSFSNILQGKSDKTYNQNTENAVTAFQQKYLPDEKPTGETGSATRKKLNELCFSKQNNLSTIAFSIVTINQPQLVKTANILKDDWQKIGIDVTVKALDLSDLKEVIKNRDYDALLYGQALSSLPDLYPFWHSTQINDPGLNLSEYISKPADDLLKAAREAIDSQTKAAKYEALQNQILADAPALFLYNFDYRYYAPKKILGIDTTKIVDPAKRFENIENWYIKTKRVWNWN